MPAWLTVKLIAYVVAAAAAVWAAHAGYSTIWQRGYDARTAEYDTAQAVATEAARTATVERNTASEAVADTTRSEAQAAVIEQQQTTGAATERVRTIIQRIEVPGSCPTTLPAEVEDEGRAAVARANGARR